MAESRIRDDSYYQVSGWMRNRLGLKGTPLQVYAIIHGFSQDGKDGFTGSLRYLSDFTGASKNTVLKALRELLALGYITKLESRRSGVKFCTYRSAPLVQKLRCGGAEAAPGDGSRAAPNKKALDKEALDTKEGGEVPPAFGCELRAAVEEWLQYKRERREPYRPTGLKALLAEIQSHAEVYGEAAVAAEIRTGMARGWRSIVFERLEEGAQKPGKAAPPPAEPDISWMKEHIERNRRRLEKRAAGQCH